MDHKVLLLSGHNDKKGQMKREKLIHLVATKVTDMLTLNVFFSRKKHTFLTLKHNTFFSWGEQNAIKTQDRREKQRNFFGSNFINSSTTDFVDIL